MDAVGMIYNFDSEERVGRIMFNTGESLPFSERDLADDSDTIMLGQKVFIVPKDDGFVLKPASIDAEITAMPDLSAQDDEKAHIRSDEVVIAITGESVNFTSIDEYIEYYSKLRFNKVKDMQVNGLRTVAFRRYEKGEFAETVVTSRNGVLDVQQMVNGHMVE